MSQSATTPFSGTITYDQVADRARTIDLGDTPASMREGFELLMLGEDHEADTRPEVTLGGVTCRLSGTDALEGLSGPIWVWFHGGGYVFGSPETHRCVTEAFAKTSGEPVVVPRYRLAPEHPWPAQLEDGVAVVRALQAKGFDVSLGGVSAGGHLAINVALVLAQAGTHDGTADAPARRLALFSPNTDRTGLNATRAVRSAMDPIVDDAFDAKLGRWTFPGVPAEDPEQSPVLADLSLLPRTHIEVGERELLRDDSTVLYAFAKRAGADVTLHEEPRAFHMWQMWTPWLREGTESIERMVAELKV